MRRAGGDVAAVCCLFHPRGERNRLSNYRRFREGVERARVRLVTVELAFGDQPYMLEAGPGVLQLRGGSLIWQKERLLQIGAEYVLEEGYEKVVLLDSDVLFDSDGWPLRVSRALETYSIVQCYSHAVQNYDEISISSPSGVNAYLGQSRLTRSSKGLAWAVRGDLIESAGLFPHCIVGAGDSALFLAAIGKTAPAAAWLEWTRNRPFLRHSSEKLAASYFAWASKFQKAMEGRAGFIRGNVAALTHGSLYKRRYHKRHYLLKRFDPFAELATHSCGALCWNDAANRRAKAVAEYFLSRA